MSTMGLVERPDHLDAKAIVSAEGHGVEDGAPGQHPSLVAMRVPGRQHLGRDRLRSNCAGGGLLR
jgi:hypothetical protein